MVPWVVVVVELNKDAVEVKGEVEGVEEVLKEASGEIEVVTCVEV